MFRHTVRCLSSLSFLPQVPSYMNLLTSQSESTRAESGYGLCVVVVIYFVFVLVSPHHTLARIRSLCICSYSYAPNDMQLSGR
jgi:hypothetical protein